MFYKIFNTRQIVLYGFEGYSFGEILLHFQRLKKSTKNLNHKITQTNRHRENCQLLRLGTSISTDSGL